MKKTTILFLVISGLLISACGVKGDLRASNTSGASGRIKVGF